MLDEATDRIGIGPLVSNAIPLAHSPSIELQFQLPFLSVELLHDVGLLLLFLLLDHSSKVAMGERTVRVELDGPVALPQKRYFGNEAYLLVLSLVYCGGDLFGGRVGLSAFTFGVHLEIFVLKIGDDLLFPDDLVSPLLSLLDDLVVSGSAVGPGTLGRGYPC